MLGRRHEIAPADAAALFEASPDGPRARITGEVVDAHRHETVRGVELVARIPERSYGGDDHGHVLGAATTGADGRFTIVLGDDAPEWARTMLEHGHETELAIDWAIDGHGGTVSTVLHPLEQQQFVVVEIALEGTEERPIDWAELAEHAAAAGASRVNEIA